ncbi:MAG: hypothetical protein NVS3B21_03370 [Acidimicrobiales bacterium]
MSVAEVRLAAERSPLHQTAKRCNVIAPASAVSLFCAVWIYRTIVSFQGRSYLTLFDDGMISMRYARNLAQGHGLVWNAGLKPVEGYTNFGWMLWMAAVHTIGLEGTSAVLAVEVSAVALTVGGLWIVRSIAEELDADRRVAGVAVWLTALSYPLAYWAVRGMEVAVLAVCTSGLALGLLRLRRRPADRRVLVLMGATTSVALLVRTDAVIVCATVAAVAWLWSPRGAGRRITTATIGGSILATLGLHTAFRYLYYGDPLPNTYYLKVVGTTLGTRLIRGIDATAAIASASLLPLVLFAIYALVRGRSDRARTPLFALGALVAMPTAYSIYVGGDAWELMQFANRYVSPSLPVLSVLAAVGLVGLIDAPVRLRRVSFQGLAVLALLSLVGAERAWIPTLGLQYILPGTRDLAERVVATLLGAVIFVGLPVLLRHRGGRREIIGAVIGIALILDGQSVLAWARSTGPHVSDDASMALYGLVIKQTTTPSARVAVMWAGASPYYSGRESLDLLGKSDAKIAHEASQPVPFYPGHTKWDYDWSIGNQRPDLVADLFRDTPALDHRLVEWGYDRLSPKIWVRHDSSAVDRSGLIRELADHPRITRLVERHL